MDLNYIKNRIHEILLGKIAMGGEDDGYAGGEGSAAYDMEMQQMRYGSGIKKQRRNKKAKVRCKCGDNVCRCKVSENKKMIRPENTMQHLAHIMPMGMGGKYYKAKQGKQGGMIRNKNKMFLPLIGNTYLGNGRMRKAKKSKGKRSSAWIDHVKNYAKEHNISYREALSQAKVTY